MLFRSPGLLRPGLILSEDTDREAGEQNREKKQTGFHIGKMDARGTRAVTRQTPKRRLVRERSKKGRPAIAPRARAHRARRRHDAELPRLQLATRVAPDDRKFALGHREHVDALAAELSFTVGGQAK